MSRIAILVHERQYPLRSTYLIEALRAAWQARGLEVSHICGCRRPPACDLLIPHVDLTHTPSEYIEYVRSAPRALNVEVTDISKRRISRHLLGRDSDYSGPVIVKTDTNAGGGPEQLCRWRSRLLLRGWRVVLSMLERLPGQQLRWLPMLCRYPVFGDLASVPAGVWRNPALVVERFLPETEGDRYFMRHYLFLGDRHRSVRVAGTEPFLKRRACQPVEEGLPVPEPVLQLRRDLGLDYGKIDYTLHEGQAIVLDVNRTPGGPGSPEATARTVADLVDGIWSLLDRV